MMDGRACRLTESDAEVLCGDGSCMMLLVRCHPPVTRSVKAELPITRDREQLMAQGAMLLRGKDSAIHRLE